MASTDHDDDSSTAPNCDTRLRRCSLYGGYRYLVITVCTCISQQHCMSCEAHMCRQVTRCDLLVLHPASNAD